MSYEELDLRKQHILKAIVDDYIQSMEPVGSRTIAKKYDVGLSSATIRNEMADLEDMGYLSQPHTSAGRIPSDKGYRTYVDHLLDIDETFALEFFGILGHIEQRVDELSKAMRIATKMISKATQYTSFSLMDKSSCSSIKACKIVPVERGRVLVLVILENDSIRNRLVNVDPSLTFESLIALSNILNEELQGKNCQTISLDLVNKIVEKSRIKRLLVLPIIDGIIATLEDKDDYEIYTEGTSNLLVHPEFNDLSKTKVILELVNDEDALALILRQSAKSGNLIVRIGHENDLIEISDCSIITATYRINDFEIGTIGVLGPTRMDYKKVISSLEYVRKKLYQDMNQILNGSK